MTATGNNHRIGVYDGKIAGLYDLEETLGSGHFAVVKLARHVFTGEKVAVKVIDKTKLDEVSKAHLFQEVRCMKLVQHPNVVRLYEVIDTQTKLYLILELGDGGDLYDYIMKHEGGLQETLAKEYFRQIVRAISYCHQLHVVHRDLKPENVVFFEKLGVVKLTDFGFSNKFNPGQKLETSCGSLAYSAPEILLGDSYDAPAVDIWSLGVILYMLVAGHAPFQEANDSETLTMIMDCKYTIPSHISPECKNLISTMLVVAPDKRSTLKQISQHPWLATDDHSDHVPEYLPLVSREQVSEEDHNTIIQKMVNGNIAAKEEIVDALDKNEYNHITATYFLLAERKLRAQRQELAQKKRPELSLPVSISRLIPKSKENENKPNQIEYVLQQNVGHLCVPRTPGTDGTQTGRIRKCSIVQEEIDDEEEEVDEENVSFNRRGSRSEGRINITVQDRIAETERLKKEAAVPPKGCFDGLSGVTLVSSDPKEKLGLLRRPGDLRTGDVNRTLANKTAHSERSHSVDPVDITGPMDNISSTKFLTDSATITIPINSQTYNPAPVPKQYKTMPSPTRANTILPGANCLNEIFEEGTDVGSSDCSSATNTPRPVARQNHYLSNRAQSHNSTTQRRSKFHKTRTASCSSSDASDDEENRKKRAHKMVESTTNPIQSQRRDSHDDSSDSQDPGSASAGTSQSGTIVQHANIVENPTSAQDQNSHRHTGGTSNGRQKSGQTVGFKRHRAGRRRAGETRLRESQSLNRITEVQESEIQIPLTTAHNAQQAIASKNTNEKVAGGGGNNRKGFSARLLSFGFRKSDNVDGSRIPPQASDEEVEIALGVELAKALKVTEAKNSSATKKLKMLGRYFQVATEGMKNFHSTQEFHTKYHPFGSQKLCIPIPGIFQRGRLYKAQSCSSIVRDKVQQPHMQTATTDRHSAIFTDKSRILRNCLGSRILGSDSDINQNNGQTQSNVLLTLNATTKKKPAKGCIARSSSPLHRHLGDSSLCSSQC